MIQRIQTVYLFIVCVLSLVSLFASVGSYVVNGEEVAEFGNFTFNTFGAFAEYSSAGPWALGIILIVVAFLSIVTIMLYHKRMRQLRLTILTSILLVGYMMTYAFFAYVYNEKLLLFNPDQDVQFTFPLIACMPAVSLILNILAICGIRKDEAIVRSLDRIR